MKTAATIIGVVGGVIAVVLGAMGMVSGSQGGGSLAGAIGFYSALLGVGTVLIAAIAVRRNPAGTGFSLLMLGAICFTLFWPAGLVIVLGAVLAMVSVTETYGRAPLRIISTIVGVLGGSVEACFGLYAGALIFSQYAGAEFSPAALGLSLRTMFLSRAGLAFLAAYVTLMAATVATRKYPVAAGILMLLAAGASWFVYWPFALPGVLAGVLAILGVTERDAPRVAAGPERT